MNISLFCELLWAKFLMEIPNEVGYPALIPDLRGTFFVRNIHGLTISSTKLIGKSTPLQYQDRNQLLPEIQQSNLVITGSIHVPFQDLRYNLLIANFCPICHNENKTNVDFLHSTIPPEFKSGTHCLLYFFAGITRTKKWTQSYCIN